MDSWGPARKYERYLHELGGIIALHVKLQRMRQYCSAADVQRTPSGSHLSKPASRNSRRYRSYATMFFRGHPPIFNPLMISRTTSGADMTKGRPTGLSLRPTTSPGWKKCRHASTIDGAPVSSMIPLVIMVRTASRWYRR